MVLIRVENVSKSIGKRNIVKNLSFTIDKGEIVGFLGPNGAGKSTTMKMMTGLISISDGDIFIDRYSIKNQRQLALRKVGGIIETPDLYKFMNAYDNLLYFQRLTGSVDKNKAEQILELLGLSHVKKQKVKSYSLGMKQRLGIAQALLTSPEVLILDEPTNGLDPEGIKEIRHYLRKLASEQGVGIFVSSHLLSEIELLCDRVIIIKDGEIKGSEYLNSHELNKQVTVSISMKLNQVSRAKNSLLAAGETILSSANDQILLETDVNKLPEINKMLIESNIDIYFIEPKNISLENRYFNKVAGD